MMTDPDFQLHPRLQQDCFDVGKLDLCKILLMNESRYPWCILVPERHDIKEIFQLSSHDQHLLQQESSLLSQALSLCLNADKMNVAAIGNMVPQLHIHVIARFQTDAAWPAPVWGKFDAQPYADNKHIEMIHTIKTALADNLH